MSTNTFTVTITEVVLAPTTLMQLRIKKQSKHWIKKAYENDYLEAEKVWNEFEMWNY